MLPNRPKITDAEVDRIANYFFSNNLPSVLLIGIRGYFLNTLGKVGENDFNLWDDAMLVYEKGTLLKTFNANTDPSKLRADLAVLEPGVYQFYRGTHKGRIAAFRAYPEGVRLKCKRQNSKGVWRDDYCSFINIHDGGASDTWSAGCQTLPNYQGQFQFNEFRNLVYKLMDQNGLKTVTYLLIEESKMREILGAK